MASSNAAELAPYDPAWPQQAAQQIAAIRAALTGCPGADEAAIEHIGSTSVPGLAAKPFIDLQIRILPLPAEEDIAARLTPLGFVRALGSRPDSPGVYRDLPRGDDVVPAEVWEKRLFVRLLETELETEPESDSHNEPNPTPTILHIRRSDSPWGHYTVWFRDWLVAHPAQRRRYESLKQELAQANHGKADYDDYTRAKTAFFDEVQATFTAWGAEHTSPQTQ